MAGIETYEVAKGRNKRERQRYRVIYRRPDGKQTSKSGFKTKAEVEKFIASVEHSKSRGEYIDPKHTRALFRDLAPQWLKNKKVTVKPSTYQTYESRYRIHVLPRWGNVKIHDLTPTDVQTWITELHESGKSASLISDCLSIIIGVLDFAEKDRMIIANTIRNKVTLPKRKRRSNTYLNAAEVHRLAMNSTHPDIIFTLAYTGMRWGELTALRVGRIDFQNRRIRIESSITTLRDGTISEGTPKNGETRVIVFPEFLRPILQKNCKRKHREDFVFMSASGGVLRPPSSNNGWFRQAVKRAGLPSMVPHDLRHTTASLAVSAGANVKAVQRMLGHSSAAMTLDIYADLFDEDLVGVADVLDEMAKVAGAECCRNVADLDVRASS